MIRIFSSFPLPLILLSFFFNKHNNYCNSFSLKVDNSISSSIHQRKVAKRRNSKSNLIQLSSSNVGKGDDTIKVLNQLETVFIDASLSTDPAFWDYCVVTREQQGKHMYVLHATNSDDNNITIKDSLCQGGVIEEGDVVFYQDEYDIFKEEVITTNLSNNNYDTILSSKFEKFGIVVSTSVLKNMMREMRNNHDNNKESSSLLEQCFKVIEVRENDYYYDEEEEEEEEEEVTTTTQGDKEESVFSTPDISVNALGELRALTICSFGALNKKQ
mmetsp:Transcript_32165/g.36572  ORF Transcript_32165/g.36572 Transcript_32165/m.36572 type:complete len:272 (-) Transcript_32165:121-936(-)